MGVLPAGIRQARESGEAEAVSKEYAEHYNIDFFGPSPMKS
jgi:ribose transport system substrate-binding protein